MNLQAAARHNSAWCVCGREPRVLFQEAPRLRTYPIHRRVARVAGGHFFFAEKAPHFTVADQKLLVCVDFSL